MTPRTWKPQPLQTIIVDLLRRKGSTSDAELHNMIKEIYDDLGFDALNRELMRLEIGGVLRISPLARGKRQVRLLGEEKEDRG